MPAATTRIESWRIDAVRRYLQDNFPGSRIEEYPRGNHTTHLYVVHDDEGLAASRPTTHHLLVTRQFFERFSDPGTLRASLVVARMARQLQRSEQRTITLY